jgi:hypothetical protein
MSIAITVRLLIVLLSTAAPPLQEKNETQAKSERQREPKPVSGPEDAEIRRLVQDLGNANFEVRETAQKRLRELGEGSLRALESAQRSGDIEIRRRSRDLMEIIWNDKIARLDERAAASEKAKDYKRAAETLDQAVKLAKSHYHQQPRTTPPSYTPYLSTLFLRLARSRVALGEHFAAATAYHQALYYTGTGRPIATERIESEWQKMVVKLETGWRRRLESRTQEDEHLRALIAKYRLVLLHSRRYAVDRYFHSAYSFVYGTQDTERHNNDVQLLFDNGQGERTFQVNCTTAQDNRIVNLGHIDFEADIDLEKTLAKVKFKDREIAVKGDVYLERVDDTEGNHFHVLLKVVALDEESRYVAFVWRRLPGGTVVRRR